MLVILVAERSLAPTPEPTPQQERIMRELHSRWGRSAVKMLPNGTAIVQELLDDIEMHCWFVFPSGSFYAASPGTFDRY